MTGEQKLELADKKFAENDIDSALQLYREAAAAAENESNNSVLVEAISQIGRCYIKRKDLEQGRDWLSRAEVSAKADEPLGWSRYLGVKGRLEWQEAMQKGGDPAPEVPEAAVTFAEMYGFCIDNELYERAIDAANMMTIVGRLEDREAWGMKGIDAAEKGGFVNQLAMLWNNHGWNLHDLGRLNESLEALKKARDYHYKGGRELPKLIADWSVGYAYKASGDLDSAWNLLNDVHVRTDSLYAVEATAENAEWLGLSARELGEISLMRGQKAEALVFYEKAKARLVEAGMPEWDKKSYAELESKIAELKS